MERIDPLSPEEGVRITVSGDSPRRVRVLVTIDTEEDDWGSYVSSGTSVSNVEHLLELRGIWERFGVRPTYFVNFPVLAEEASADVMGVLASETDCEMAAHCHPWNTPPFVDDRDKLQTMMNNLSDEENAQKLAMLTDLFQERFHHRPISFRAGRWGFGPSVARPLSGLGYSVDASVSPFVDWSATGGPDYSRAAQAPYRFDPDDPLVPSRNGSLVEIPTSIGFLWGSQRISASIRTSMERSAVAPFKVVGLMDRLGALARRWLSPETSTEKELLRLAGALVRSGQRVLDLTFHSSSLLPGATPFVGDRAQQERMIRRMEAFLEFCAREGFEFATVSEAADGVRSA